ncbi:MAG: sigma-70 family RNA polymerase sigma factor [Ardenticatenaceae bacterium]|nr:sigma-70 family RNA polymerase sigma factor [Ardenticatenaceae bacterium]MCB9442677.1 sigma-70 family RNA polymerase sigma factor [Ardenticatenaceae bacterium]
MTNTNLQSLTLAGVRHRCAQETDRFFSRQEHDPRFCFELFRRAVLQRDELAWEFVYLQYRPLVARWIERHPALPLCGEEAQFFLNRAFEKMWQGLTPEKFAAFDDLKSVLRYLQMCAHSVVIDFLRRKEQKALQDAVDEADMVLVSEETAVEDQLTTELERKKLWGWLEGQFNNEKERLAIYGIFVLDLKPGEVVAEYGRVFQDVKEVYRAKENVFARLRRSDEFKEMWGDA